ncbi:MAG: hypothetical protein ACK4VZ_12730 [Paracoccaceae bacterium]
MNNTDRPDGAQSQPGNQSSLGSVAADIKQAAVGKFDDAMTEVRARADDAKDGVANEVKDVAAALRRASEELRGGSAQERTLGTVASSLADVSDQIRDKDLGQIVHMVSKVARDNPMLFLGGAALLGFAASRYAKASGQAGNSHATQAETRDRVDSFVSEGNPNTQSLRSAQ